MMMVWKKKIESKHILLSKNEQVWEIIKIKKTETQIKKQFHVLRKLKEKKTQKTEMMLKASVPHTGV